MTEKDKEAALNRYLEEHFIEEEKAGLEAEKNSVTSAKRPETGRSRLIPYSNPKAKYYCLIGLLIVSIIALVIVDAVRKKDLLKVNYGFSMGTVVIENIYGEKDYQPIFDDIGGIIEECDGRLSLTNEDSLISVLNRTHTADFGKEAGRLFDPLKKLYEDSDGAFDITVGSISALWAIGTENARVPEEDEIEDGLSHIDGSLISSADGIVTSGEGQITDLGAVGKGYVCDLIKDYLVEKDIHGACISVGGSILLYGAHGDDPVYTVAIRDPEGEASDTIGTLALSDCCVSTSGNYEKTYEEYGVIYHHIMDPKTGYPVENDLVSATVISDSGLLSDALSTACFTLGLEKGMALAQAYGAEAVFIDHAHQVFVTPGTELNITNDRYRFADPD